MEPSLATLGTEQPWPAPCVCPPLPVLDRGDLVNLQSGDVEADATEVLAACSARSRGALDLAVGDGLAAMRQKDRLIQLGYSCLGDYAREVLGIPERTAQNLAHLSRELRKRPLLRAAVCKGEVLQRRAQAVLPVAVGEAEAEWVDRARFLSVGMLEMLVRAVRDGLDEDEEEWRELRSRISAEDWAIVDEALAVAGKVLGSGASRAQRLEAWGQEYVGGHPVEADDEDRPAGKECHAPRTEALERRKAQLEVETQCWYILGKVPESSVPEGAFDETASAEQVDAELRRLSAMRSSWDDLFGHAALSIKASGIGGSSALRTSPTTARSGLASRSGRSSSARRWSGASGRCRSSGRPTFAGSCPTSRPGCSRAFRMHDIPAWIPRAHELTCIQLRRALEAEKEAQLRTSGRFLARLPTSVALTLSTAFRAVRAAENPLWSDGQCLVALARHFLEVWKPLLTRRRTQSQRVRERDSGCCQVPGCSRRAAHAHHVEPRSHLGPSIDENLVGICAVHHLRGVHGGYVRVTGTAPNGLVWELGGKVWMDRNGGRSRRGSCDSGDQIA